MLARGLLVAALAAGATAQVCATFHCPDGFTPRATPDLCPAAGCTNALCCDVLCSNSDFQCSVGFQLKKEPFKLNCGHNLTACLDSECCDFVTSRAIDARITLGRKAYCTEDKDCQLRGDKLGKCDAATQQCTCSDFHVGDKVCDGHANTKTVDYSARGIVSGTRFSCNSLLGTAEKLQATRRAFAAAIADVFEGKVLSLGVACGSGGALAYAARLEIHNSAWYRTKSDYIKVVGGTESADATLGALLFERLLDEEVLRLASPSQVVHNGRTFIDTNVNNDLTSSTRRRATPTPANTALALLAFPTRGINGGGVTVALQCNTDKRPSTTNTNGACGSGGGTMCVLDADCTAALPAGGTHVNLCVNWVCTQPLKPAALPAIAKDKWLRVPSLVRKHWCVSDEGCRAHGDAFAECDQDAGLGNWCKCSHGYEYPSPFVAICLKKLSGEAKYASVEYGVSLKFKDLTCPVTDAQTGAVKALIEKELGPVVKGVEGDVLRSYCTSAGATFLAKTNVSLALASDISKVTKSDRLLMRMRAEIAGTPLGDRTLLNATERFASVMAATGVYVSLGDANLSSVVVGAPYQCESPGARVASLDSRGWCQAAECDAKHELWTVNGLTGCKPELRNGCTRAGPVVDDDDLTKAQIAGLVIGLVSAVALIFLLVWAFLKREKPAPLAEEEVVDEE